MARKRGLTRKELALIAKRLGAGYHISVDALLKKLCKIVDDKTLPQSVKDAAQREIDKFMASKFWGA